MSRQPVDGLHPRKSSISEGRAKKGKASTLATLAGDSAETRGFPAQGEPINIDFLTIADGLPVYINKKMSVSENFLCSRKRPLNLLIAYATTLLLTLTISLIVYVSVSVYA